MAGSSSNSEGLSVQMEGLGYDDVSALSSSFTWSSNSSTYYSEAEPMSLIADRGNPNEAIDVSSKERLSVEAPCSDNTGLAAKSRWQLVVQKKCSSITLLGYSWVDVEVCSNYSRYTDKVNLLYLINHVRVCWLMDEDSNPIHLCCY